MLIFEIIESTAILLRSYGAVLSNHQGVLYYRPCTRALTSVDWGLKFLRGPLHETRPEFGATWISGRPEFSACSHETDLKTQVFLKMNDVKSPKRCHYIVLLFLSLFLMFCDVRLCNTLALNPFSRATWNLRSVFKTDLRSRPAWISGRVYHVNGQVGMN